MRGAALALAILTAAAAASADTVAIVGGTVHTVSGPALEDAIVLIEDDRIVAVGVGVSVPEGALRVDARGRVVTPGLVDAATAVGLVEVSSLDDTRDESLEGGDPFRVAFMVRDGLHPDSIVIPETRLGGVTTVGVLPERGAISGQGAVLDLDGRTAADLVVREPAMLAAAFDPDAAETTGGARGALALRLREAFDDARFYDEHRDAFLGGDLRPLALSRLDLEALQPVLAGEIPVAFRVSRASDIDVVLDLASEYRLELVLVGAEEAWRRREALAEAGVPVVVKAYANLPLQFDRLGSRFDNAALLDTAGVEVALSTLDTHNARNLRFEAGQAVRHGLPWERALRAITLVPARVLGIESTHGSLEAGKTANVVVWSGDPFEPASEPERVFIRGREIEKDSRQHRLLERYRTLP